MKNLETIIINGVELNVMNIFVSHDKILIKVEYAYSLEAGWANKNIETPLKLTKVVNFDFTHALSKNNKMYKIIKGAVCKGESTDLWFHFEENKNLMFVNGKNV